VSSCHYLPCNKAKRFHSTGDIVLRKKIDQKKMPVRRGGRGKQGNLKPLAPLATGKKDASPTIKPQALNGKIVDSPKGEELPENGLGRSDKGEKKKKSVKGEL